MITDIFPALVRKFAVLVLDGIRLTLGLQGSPLDKALSRQNQEACGIWSQRAGQLAPTQWKKASPTDLPAEAQHVGEACRRLLCSSLSLGANPAACTSTW